MRTIRVVPYDNGWPARFQEIAGEVAGILAGEIVAIHHIGSTAVPGLAAKPIIDLLVEVRDIARVDGYNPAIEAHGYLPKGEHGIPGRRFFIKGSEEERLAHIHIFAQGDPAIARHLAFRDYLLRHPAEAATYGELKQELARKHPHDIEAYMAGKRELVERLEAEALAWQAKGKRAGR